MADTISMYCVFWVLESNLAVTEYKCVNKEMEFLKNKKEEIKENSLFLYVYINIYIYLLNELYSC
jgi:hypothetical protein